MSFAFLREENIPSAYRHSSRRSRIGDAPVAVVSDTDDSWGDEDAELVSIADDSQFLREWNSAFISLQKEPMLWDRWVDGLGASDNDSSDDDDDGDAAANGENRRGAAQQWDEEYARVLRRRRARAMSRGLRPSAGLSAPAATHSGAAGTATSASFTTRTADAHDVAPSDTDLPDDATEAEIAAASRRRARKNATRIGKDARSALRKNAEAAFIKELCFALWAYRDASPGAAAQARAHSFAHVSLSLLEDGVLVVRGLEDSYRRLCLHGLAALYGLQSASFTEVRDGRQVRSTMIRRVVLPHNRRPLPPLSPAEMLQLLSQLPVERPSRSKGGEAARHESHKLHKQRKQRPPPPPQHHKRNQRRAPRAIIYIDSDADDDDE